MMEKKDYNGEEKYNLIDVYVALKQISYRIPEFFRAFKDLLALIGLPVGAMVIPTETQNGDDDQAIASTRIRIVS